MPTKREALEKSEKEMQDAFDSLDPAYHKYIVKMGRKSRCSDGEVYIEAPYLDVAGRIKLAVDECRGLGKELSISTEFTEIAGQVVCKATVMSSFGMTVGHARAFTDGGGGFVDRTNPLENAETSAIGRALGMQGYGLFGGGLASADEVKAAQVEQERLDREPPPPPKTVVQGHPPTEKQLAFLEMLKEQKALHPDYKDMPVTTRTEVSQAIEYLKELKDGERDPVDEVEASRRKFWVDVRAALSQSGRPESDLKEFIWEQWGIGSTADLTVRQRTICIEKMGQVPEPDMTEEETRVAAAALKRSTESDGGEDDIPEPAEPTTDWGNVLARAVDKGIDKSELELYLVDQYKPTKGDVWHIETAAAKRINKLLDTHEGIDMLNNDIEQFMKDMWK